MLAKKFITLSKLPLRAPVLFTNKKNRGLHLCIDYCSLNVIIKKNKYLLSLVRMLLDRLADAKYYIKFNIITAYNVLHIQTSDK